MVFSAFEIKLRGEEYVVINTGPLKPFSPVKNPLSENWCCDCLDAGKRKF